MDRKMFLEAIGGSLFKGAVTPNQQRGMDAKLRAFDALGVADERWCAYMLATSYHETGGTLWPVEEIGKGKGKPYGEKRKQDGSVYLSPDRLYYGRGDVQLTWYENYERMGEILGIPLLTQPELALEPDISARILIEGMTPGRSGRGDFTGFSLADFFNARRDDPVNARKTVNGLDRADTIADYYRKFLAALRMAMMVALLFLAGCKPCQSVTETSVAYADSSAVKAWRDSLYRQERQIACLQTELQRAKEEAVRYRGETRTREVRYDTSLPPDSLTGKAPVLSELFTCTQGQYEKEVVEEAVQRVERASAEERLLREQVGGVSAVVTTTAEDRTLQERAPAPRFHYKLFPAGVVAGIALAIVTGKLWARFF